MVRIAEHTDAALANARIRLVAAGEDTGMGTGEHRETVAGMAEAIDARRQELGIASIAEFERRTGITREGLKPLLAGERRRYQDRLKWPVCAALGWTADSIDRLLRGEPAQMAGVPELAATELSSLAASFRASVEAIEQSLDGLWRQLESVEERVAAQRAEDVQPAPRSRTRHRNPPPR